MTEPRVGSALPAYSAATTALLHYKVTPERVYTTNTKPGADQPSAINLLFQVRNDGEGPVACQWIRVTLPIGDGAGDLTADAAGIRPTSNQPLRWVIASEGGGAFRIVPAGTGIQVEAGESMSFRLAGILVNKVEGLAALFVEELADQVRSPDIGGTPAVAKATPTLEFKSFKATRAVVDPGEESILTWETVGASYCTLATGSLMLSGDLRVDEPTRLDPNGQESVRPQHNTLYTLTVYGDGPTLSPQVVVAVRAPGVTDFKAIPNEIDPGDSATLTWTTNDDTERCSVSSVGDNLKPNDSVTVKPAETTTYELRACRGSRQTLPVPAKVVVRTVTIQRFTASAAPDAPGVRVRLAWDVARATKVTLSGFGDVAPKDSRDIMPTADASYTLTVSGGGGSDIASVNVQRPGWYQSASVFAQSMWAPAAMSLPDAIVLVSGLLMSDAGPGGPNPTAYRYTAAGWSASPSTPLNRTDAAGAYFNGKLWITGGQPCGGGWYDVMSSLDGITWAPEAASTPWSRRASGHGCVAYKGALWVLLTESGAAVWRSPNGKDWTAVPVKPKSTPNPFDPYLISMRAVATADAIWVLGATSKSGVILWKSADGADWTQVATLPIVAPPSEGNRHYVMEAIGGIVYIVGMGTDGAAGMWSVASSGTALRYPLPPSWATADDLWDLASGVLGNRIILFGGGLTPRMWYCATA